MLKFDGDINPMILLHTLLIMINGNDDGNRMYYILSCFWIGEGGALLEIAIIYE